jgi:hypothetical protein
MASDRDSETQQHNGVRAAVVLPFSYAALWEAMREWERWRAVANLWLAHQEVEGGGYLRRGSWIGVSSPPKGPRFI